MKSSEECYKLSSHVKFKKLKGEVKEPERKEVKEEAPDVGRTGCDCVPMLPQGKWGKVKPS